MRIIRFILWILILTALIVLLGIMIDKDSEQVEYIDLSSNPTKINDSVVGYIYEGEKLTKEDLSQIIVYYNENCIPYSVNSEDKVLIISTGKLDAFNSFCVRNISDSIVFRDILACYSNGVIQLDISKLYRNFEWYILCDTIIDNKSVTMYFRIKFV